MKLYIGIATAVILLIVVVLVLNKRTEKTLTEYEKYLANRDSTLISEIRFLQDQQQVVMDSIVTLKAELSTITRKETKIYNTYVQENDRIDSLSATKQRLLFYRNSQRLLALERAGYFGSTPDGR